MTLTIRDEHSFGTEESDIALEISRFSELRGYVAQHFACAQCSCGSKTFTLAVDENEGAGVRTCSSCKKEHPIGDSDEYLDDAELAECSCLCGADIFEIAIGVSLYEDSEDVHWLYLGCRCPSCGLTGVYGDWKNEFNGFQALLARV